MFGMWVYGSGCPTVLNLYLLSTPAIRATKVCAVILALVIQSRVPSNSSCVSIDLCIHVYMKIRRNLSNKHRISCRPLRQDCRLLGRSPGSQVCLVGIVASPFSAFHLMLFHNTEVCQPCAVDHCGSLTQISHSQGDLKNTSDN